MITSSSKTVTESIYYRRLTGYWRHTGLVCLTTLLLASQCLYSDEGLKSQWRRPVAIALIDDGRNLVTLNQRSGTLSVLNAERMTVVREVAIGRRPSDLAVLPTDPSLILVTDEEAHELLAVRQRDGTWTVEQRIAVSPYPVTVTISTDGRRAFVASLWSRTVSTIDLTAWLKNSDQRAAVVKPTFLSFAPRETLFVDKADRLLVADAFGGKLAVIDTGTGLIESVRELGSHGVRQLSLHPTKPRIVMTHQMLNRLAHTTLDDVHWGNLMTNCLRSLPLADVLNPRTDLLQESQIEYLGGPERGAGDPFGFVIRPDGVIAVTLAGTNELILNEGGPQFGKRLPVQDRPAQLILSADGGRVFMINTLSDSVTAVHLARREVQETVSLGPHPDPTATDRGERLFHNSRLSHDGWFSCASCHVDGHTSGQLNDNQTDGSFDTTKRVLSLRGVADTAPYAWNGRFPTLAEQIRHSVVSTMQGNPLEESQVSDLEAYLRTLPPAPAVGSRNKGLVARGAAEFERLNCARCHTAPAYTSSTIADVKIRDERGATRFNPPSLRGVSQNGPYFHDGRAETLEEVFSQHRHQLDEALTPDQITDLVAFLSSL